MSARTLVIVNPGSRNGALGRRWRSIEPTVRERLGPFEVDLTRGPRDAERIAREGVRAGIERVIVAGGDGTLNEVASGLLGAGLGGYAQLGVLPLGTGGDFARSLGVPHALESALAVLERGKTRRIDAGRIAYADKTGREVVGHFVNIASFGISGLIDELVDRATKRLGGTIAFLLGTLEALVRHRAERVRLRVDGEVVCDGPLVLATAANGCYFGGGMHVAPDARLDDGWLDVIVIPELPRGRLLRHLPKLYAGTHVDVPEILVLRGRCIAAESPTGRVPLDVDGEPLGTLPTRIEVVPGALEVIGG